ncbi:VOC family protein [Caenimonas terrae]|uniref:VOC family protein n=1 Tax=Caenimonas terrae TaxID=696074 RepID=A0ABW0NI00_9BURK
MFSHVMVGTSDLDRSKRFYDATLATLGIASGFVDRHRVFWRSPAGAFGTSLPINGQAQTIGNGSTVGFACDSPTQVDAWHAAGMHNGGTSCEDPPGVREGTVGKLYLAYLRDPDGNKLCAMHRLPKG